MIPLAHHENIYALPDDLAGRIARMARRVAIAMRRGYPCDGVTVRQNNEPAGDQDVWHLHTHVIPRHTGDNLRRSRFGRADDAEARPLRSPPARKPSFARSEERLGISAGGQPGSLGRGGH